MDGLFTETTPRFGDNNIGWEKGKSYEKWVIERWPIVYQGGLRKRTLTLFGSEQEQYRGETRERVEIKNDSLIDKYQRLCIETHEKRFGENTNYIESGILKTDNTCFYLVGDYQKWWLFAKEHLLWLLKKDPPYLYHYKTDTSIGYCLPIKNAHRVCLDYVEFDEDGKPRDDTWLEGL